jgi:hypothetical protein
MSRQQCLAINVWRVLTALLKSTHVATIVKLASSGWLWAWLGVRLIYKVGRRFSNPSKAASAGTRALLLSPECAYNLDIYLYEALRRSAGGPNLVTPKGARCSNIEGKRATMQTLTTLIALSRPYGRVEDCLNGSSLYSDVRRKGRTWSLLHTAF